MFISNLCAPAIIYIGFSLIQIIVDLYKGVFSNAFVKFIVMIVFSVIINILCDLGYTVIAWFLVFIPIIMMTIVSTLLLKVFGTNPNEKDLRAKVEGRTSDISNNIYLDDSGSFHLMESDRILSGSNLLNQQKYAYFYDRFNAVQRINRDNVRKNFYDNVDKAFKLNSPNNIKYDLSNNPIKYSIVDWLINSLGENNFTNSIVNFLFSDQQLSSHPYPYTYINANNNNLSQPVVDFRLNKMKGNDFESYSKKYDDQYLLDGYLLYQRHKYEKTKEKLGSNATNVQITQEIEKNWDLLTLEEQKQWNKTSEEEKDKVDTKEYDPYEFERYRPAPQPVYESKHKSNGPCPTNETTQSFKEKTGLDCYEVCQPGKSRNSAGICVRHCPTGMERKVINGGCVKI